MPDVMRSLPALVARFCPLPAERIDAASAFAALDGWGSLAALQLLAAVEREYAVELDLPGFLALRTVGELAELIGSGR